MKLLFDQNISFRIIKQIEHIFPEATQVRLLGLENAEDFEIWKYAKLYEYTIVTYDADFYDLSLIRGVPPKIIWLRLGNMATKNLVNCLTSNYTLINDFIVNEDFKELACLEIANREFPQ
ncbi:MAG: DUF5615 family PIN-like protein [Chitinophagales bacterium]|nr:DUF5615 family PIN-like protein [Chitinophagales bacterium]